MSEILIVDDEKEIRSAIRLALEREGWICHEAASSREAGEIIDSRDNIEIVFLDIRMPGQSGLEFLAKRRGRSRDPDFIVMTGDGGIKEAKEASRLGARDFLSKPFAIGRIRQALAKCPRLTRAKDSDG